MRDSLLVIFKFNLTFNSVIAADWFADVCRECKQFTIEKTTLITKCFKESESKSDDLNSSNLKEKLGKGQSKPLILC